MSTSFIDERHTLFVGWTLGIALRNGLDAEPIVDDAGNYTDRLRINLRDGQSLLVVVPYPPEGWQFEDWELADGRG